MIKSKPEVTVQVLDVDRVGRVLRDGFQKIADSLDAALATVAATNRMIREVGAQERRRKATAGTPEPERRARISGE